jgi:hypothetical protein
MKIRFSRFRTFLLTLTLGFAAVSVWTRLAAYLEEVPVDAPKVESEAPIMIRVCREPGSAKEYRENGYQYFSKEKSVNCTTGGGGGAGGGFTYDERY